MATTERQIRKLLTGHRELSACEWRAALDRASDFSDSHPEAAPGECVGAALNPKSKLQPRIKPRGVHRSMAGQAARRQRRAARHRPAA